MQSAPSTPQALDPEDPVREAVLQAATAPLSDAFGDRVRLRVQRVNRIGPWAFVLGTMHDADGNRPNFAGTTYERPAAAGQMSDVYVALVRDSGATGWQLRAHAVGPSDVAWESWPRDHEAPSELFR